MPATHPHTDAARPESLPPAARVATYFRAEVPLLAAVTVTGLVFNVGLVASPWFEGQIAQCLADVLAGTRAPSSMWWLAGGYLLAVGLAQLARFLKRLYVRRFANRVGRAMKGSLYQGVLRSDPAQLEREGAGTLMTKALSDVDACAEGMRKATTEVFDTGVALIAYSAMLLAYDWRLALVALAFPPVSYLMASLAKGPVTRASAAAKESMGRMNAATLDRVGGALTYRVFGLEDQRDQALEESLSDYELREFLANVWQNAPRPVYYAVSMSGVVLVIWLGAANVLGGGWASWDVAAFTAFLSCFTRLTLKSSRAANLFNAVQRARVSWSRIRRYLARDVRGMEGLPAEDAEEPAGEEGRAPDAAGEEDDTAGLEGEERLPGEAAAEASRPCGNGGARRGLLVDGLTVEFPGVGRVLDRVGFSLAPGQVIGVTGEVASGKTTLGRAIAGQVEHQGTVLFDGSSLLPVDGQGPAELAYLGYDPELLEASVADNVTLGAPGDPWPALRAAQLDREVLALPRGADTPVGEGGVRLSGGQRARLGLARAIFYDRPLMVLDDPFSAVDMRTERLVFQAIRDLARTKGTCVVLLSHRLALFPQMDFVGYLESGRLLCADHARLMEVSPGYARLWGIQNARRSEGGDADVSRP